MYPYYITGGFSPAARTIASAERMRAEEGFKNGGGRKIANW